MQDIENQLTGLIDDPDFLELNHRFGRFNIFEAVGAVRGELRHSNFLAFLMSPHASHGLGSEPLQRILRSMLEQCPSEVRPIGSLNIAVGDLDGADVRREEHNIDILIELKEFELVVAIENKVDSSAGDGQLKRYASVINSHFPNYRHLLVFLTPDGTEPREEGWTAYGYTTLATTIDSLLKARTPPPGETALVLKHYTEMLRRHIVEDEKLKELAMQLYLRHRDALDFIFECRADGQENLLNELLPIIKSHHSLQFDSSSATALRFAPTKWSQCPALNTCPTSEWTKTGRNLLFQVRSYKTDESGARDKIHLSLVLGPSTPQLQAYLHQKMSADPKTFSGISKTPGTLWSTVFKRELLSPKAASKMEEDEKRKHVRDAFMIFMETDFTILTEAAIRIISEFPAPMGAVQ